MNQVLQAAVVGCGYWGPNLARNLNSNGACHLAAVCDLDPERLAHMKTLYPEVLGFLDFEQMLQQIPLDVVVIATPVQDHYRLAMACLQAGKHVLVEKPMAASERECLDLIHLARQKGLTLMVGHTFLYSEPVRVITDLVKSREIGDLMYINCQRLNLGVIQNDINAAWDLAPHDLSILLHILGEMPESLNCQGNALMGHDVEDVTNMTLRFPGNRLATIQSSWLEPRKVRQMTFVGTRKMIVYNDVEPLEKLRIYDTRVEHPPHYDTFGEFPFAYHYGPILIPHLNQEEPLKRMVQEFLDCVRNGEEPQANGLQGLQLVRILEASSESLRKNGSAVEISTSFEKELPLFDWTNPAFSGQPALPV